MPVALKPLVLSVDDDTQDRRLVERALAGKFEVHSCGSGEEALSVLEKSRAWSVVISDQRLPGITGAELLERVAFIAPHAGRLLVTADPSFERLSSPTTVLYKPVPPDTLASFVEKLALLSDQARAAAGKAKSLVPSSPAMPKPPKLLVPPPKVPPKG